MQKGFLSPEKLPRPWDFPVTVLGQCNYRYLMPQSNLAPCMADAIEAAIVDTGPAISAFLYESRR
jgi:hypothetical protein